MKGDEYFLSPGGAGENRFGRALSPIRGFGLRKGIVPGADAPGYGMPLLWSYSREPLRKTARVPASSTGGAGGFCETRAAGRSDHQDLVAQMKGNPFENVAAPMVVRAETPAALNGEWHGIDNRNARTVEKRRSARRVGLHELTSPLAAAVVARVMVIGRGGWFVLVFVLVMGVLMKMSAANDWQNPRLVARRSRGDVLMMPTAADHRMQQQRDGGEGGD